MIKKLGLIICMLSILIPIVFSGPSLCIDSQERLFNLNNVIISMKIDSSNLVIENGNNLVLDFRNYRADLCLEGNGDLMVSDNLILDLKIEDDLSKQIILSTDSIFEININYHDSDINGLVEDIQGDEMYFREKLNLKNCYGYRLEGNNVNLEASFFLDVPLCTNEEGSNTQLSLCSELRCENILGAYELLNDIGLRYEYNGKKYSISVETGDTVNSKLRIYKQGRVYGIVLVNPSHEFASPYRVEVDGQIYAIRHN